jgi:1-acyl-sn-glycerol-3-phosphate acyltransferase
MLRTAWFLLNLLVYTAWYASKAVIAGVLKVRNRLGGVYDECARRWSVRMIKVAGVEIRTSGYASVPQNRPVVYVSNHQSWFDIWVMSSIVPGQCRFVAKKELQKIPVLGRAMRSAGHIYIDRQNRQKAFSAYEAAAAYIRKGMSAVLFPEGTRSRTGDLLPFKKGPFVLALAAQVPVIPVYIAGTFSLLPKGSVTINPNPVAVMFGEEIPTEGMEYEDRTRLMSVTRKAIEQLRVDSQDVLG